jgi:hypothetical protein
VELSNKSLHPIRNPRTSCRVTRTRDNMHVCLGCLEGREFLKDINANKMESENMKWIRLVKDTNHWRALLNTVMSVQWGLFTSGKGLHCLE